MRNMHLPIAALITAFNSAAATLAVAIAAVLFVTGVLVVAFWIMARRVMRWEHDRRGLRRFLLCFALLFMGSGAVGAIQVVRGKAPAEQLIGVAVVWLLAWSYFRGTGTARTPPT
jgi:hypothetical protein